MTNDDLSIRTAGNPRIIRISDGDSVAVTNEPPPISQKTWDYLRGEAPDPERFPPLKPWPAFIVTASKL